MAETGASKSGESGVPRLNDPDEEGAGESTVAMASPQFDPNAAMPLPISNPPPAMLAAQQQHAMNAMQMPPTAPVPFVPQGIPQNMAPAGVPNMGGPRPPPFVPTPMGGITPAAGAPPQVAAPPIPPPLPAAPFGRPTGSRAQTVIGIAPPGQGAQRPPAPAAPAGPAPPRAPAAGPISPRPLPGKPGAPLPFGVSAPSPPSQPTDTQTAPRAPAPKPVDDLWPNAEESQPESAKEDGPTMMGKTEDSLALFGLDDAAAGAAAKAAALGSGAARRSPLASTGYSGPTPRPGAGQGLDQETATVAVPKDDLARARDQMPPMMGNVPPPLERMEEEESTRAVPREELLRGQDAQFIVGDDAVGEDATLAVAPGNNEANSKHLAALAETIAKDEGGFPPPMGNAGGFPPPMGPHGYPQQQQMPPQQQWQQQQHDPNQQPWSQDGRQSSPMMGGGGMQQQHPQHGMPQSNPHMQQASHMPGSNPHMPISSQMSVGPQSGQMPTSQHGMQMGQGPIPYPGHNMMQPQQQNSPWAIPGPGGTRIKLSGQIVLLAVVGVICLAIFITGIVLFATTKF